MWSVIVYVGGEESLQDCREKYELQLQYNVI